MTKHTDFHSREYFEELLECSFRGTLHPRTKIEALIRKMGVVPILREALTEQEVADLTRRVCGFQLKHFVMSQNGYIGVGLMFKLPSLDESNELFRQVEDLIVTRCDTDPVLREQVKQYLEIAA